MPSSSHAVWVAAPACGCSSFDSKTKRLWIAHMDAGELLAFDVVHRRIVKTIAAPGVPGVIAVPALGRVYASATNAPEVVTVDADAGDLLARAAAGQYPDGLRPGRAPRLRLGRERRRRDGPDGAGRGIATIPLGGEAGNVH